VVRNFLIRLHQLGMGRDNGAAAAEVCSGGWRYDSTSRKQDSRSGSSSCVKHSSSRDSRTEKRLITDIIEVSQLLISPAVRLAATTRPGEVYMYTAGAWGEFLASPAVTEVMLRLLASRCLLLHMLLVQQQKQQQQGQVLIRQLGKRMRGDLLLLADPRDRLLPLLPSDQFLAADAAALAAADSSSDVPYSVILCLTALGVGISNSAVSSRNNPRLAAAVLQLSSQLLPIAAAHWQLIYHSLSQQQQQFLSNEAADLDRDRLAELQSCEQQLRPAQQVFKRCLELLQAQLSTLWRNGQWQPQMQLLQQGGGEVLLQGLTLAHHHHHLTLAVHCSSLHCRMQNLDDR
jgi:hypothetical protein